MSAGIALRDGRARICALNLSDQPPGGRTALYINCGSGICNRQLSAVHKTDQSADGTACGHLNGRIVIFVIVILMVVSEHALHREILFSRSHQHAGVRC